jgi:hypothetical protein
VEGAATWHFPEQAKDLAFGQLPYPEPAEHDADRAMDVKTKLQSREARCGIVGQ